MPKSNFDEIFEDGIHLISQGDFAKALGFFSKAIALEPLHLGAKGNLALCQKEIGKHMDAILTYRSILNNNTEADLVAHISICECEIALGHLDTAEESLQKALQLGPNTAEAYSAASGLYSKTGQLELSLEMADKALSLRPDLATAHINRGWTLLQMGRHQEALDATLKAQSLDSSNCQTYINASTVYISLGDHENAISQAERGLSMRPRCVDLDLNICKAMKEMGFPQDALEKVECLTDRSESTLLLESEILNDLEKVDEAIACLRMAEELYSTQVKSELKHSLGCLLLKKGTLEEGWELYEHRPYQQQVSSVRNQKSTISNASIEGKRDPLLVIREQGLGDEILFGSILLDLLQKEEKIILEADPRLHNLYRRSFGGNVEIINSAEDVSTLSVRECIRIGSLGGIYRRSHGSFVRQQVAYLKADQERVKNIRSELELSKMRNVIGISWFSKGVKRQNRKKCVPLELLISAIPHVEECMIVILQYDWQERTAELRTLSKRLPNLLIPAIDQTNDIDTLAAYIMACDSIVCVSTSVAHLACALGQTTHVLLPYSALWHWGSKPRTTDWYPTAKLYRQQRLDQWEEPLAELKQALLDPTHPKA